MNAINWMIENGTSETLEDGTVTHTFIGSIPFSMKKEIINLATGERNNNYMSSYNFNGDTFSWGATFGAKKGNNLNIKFTYNDYTVPMQG